MEKESFNKNPDVSTAYIKPTTPPALVEDGEHRVLVNKNDSGVLFVRVAQGERTIFTAAVSNEQDVSLMFPDGRQVLFPNITKEHTNNTKAVPESVQQEILNLPITLEGYPVRPGKYTLDENTGEKRYKLIVAHHPNPKDRKQVVYYDLVAAGEKAEECLNAGITDTRTPVRVTGDDLSRTITKKDGTEKMVREVRIDSLEKIRERRLDSSEILREKVPLKLPR